MKDLNRSICDNCNRGFAGIITIRKNMEFDYLLEYSSANEKNSMQTPELRKPLASDERKRIAWILNN